MVEPNPTTIVRASAQPRSRLRLLMVAFAALLAACAMSPGLDVASNQASSIAGSWRLDRQSSDDVRARLEPLFAKKDRHWRKIEQEIDEQSGERINSTRAESRRIAQPEGLGGSNMQWMQDQRQREFLVLISMLSPANQIEIQQAPKQLRFSSDKGEGSRTFVPGDISSLVVGVGGFNVRSGWNKTSFLIDSRGTGDNDLHTVERYTVLNDGGLLEEILIAKIPALGKETFRFVYKRSPR
ncbi:MAG TPA: hypothetical protein VK629_13655 [Steroidobacteraceae bacterium]|nr:hypothetical protein [Steroidobacteraceae bacterium]